MAFFQQTPKDIFEKACREYDRMTQGLTIDNMWDFYMTANAIPDHLDHAPEYGEALANQMRADEDVADCRAICNQGKHCVLTRKNSPKVTTLTYSGGLNEAPLNTVTLNSGPVYAAMIDGREVYMGALAMRVVMKWKTFFETH